MCVCSSNQIVVGQFDSHGSSANKVHFDQCQLRKKAASIENPFFSKRFHLHFNGAGRVSRGASLRHLSKLAHVDDLTGRTEVVLSVVN